MKSRQNSNTYLYCVNAISIKIRLHYVGVNTFLKCYCLIAMCKKYYSYLNLTMSLGKTELHSNHYSVFHNG